ncbi:MAG: hypothetical protein ACRDDL_08845 [Sarcina sp.]
MDVIYPQDLDLNLLSEDLTRTVTDETNKKKPMEAPPKEKVPVSNKCSLNKKSITDIKKPAHSVSSPALSCCLNGMTYIWQNDGKEYWAYIFYIDQLCFVGWRWNIYVNDWVYFGVDLSKIEAFSCKR